MVVETLTRRAAIQGAAGVAAGLAATATRPQGASHTITAMAVCRSHRSRSPVGYRSPRHRSSTSGRPGPTDVTLPFTGGQLQGLDVEPTTIRDFNGFSAVAFHVGTATGSDGTRYDLETDMRAFRGHLHRQDRASPLRHVRLHLN